MNPALTGAATLVSAGLGLAAGLWMRPAPEPVLFPEDAGIEERADPCAAMADAMARDLSELRGSSDLLDLQVPMTRARARMHGALPSVWPDDLSDEFREESVRKSLEAMQSATLQEIDCSEYPCVYTMMGHELAETASVGGPRGEWAEELEALGCVTATTISIMAPQEDGYRQLTSTSCGRTDDPQEVRARARFRVERLHDEVYDRFREEAP